MIDIFSPPEQQLLAEFARASVLLALDYDGTLAPIVPNPAHARMRSETHALLTVAVTYYPCVVISGRAQADAERCLQGVPVAAVIGNHGVEPWASSEQLMREVRSWLPALHARLDSLPGVQIEDKLFSIAVHYRHAPDRNLARRAIFEVASTLPTIRLIGGKEVCNLVLDGAPHKGTALLRERARLGCERAIYVGDDDTDEDVFGLSDPLHLLTIRVGADAASRASHHMDTQAEIDALLRTLIELRTK